MKRDNRVSSGGFSRDGRFSITNNTNGPKEYSIINTGSRSVYRFFNSGDSAFKVNQVNTTASGVTVEPKNSIDAEISGEVTIRVNRGDTVEGIYDYVETNYVVRNGRYSGKLDLTRSPAIIYGREGSVYRIFNSGEHPFNVKYSGVVSELEPRESHDFVVKGIVQIGTDSQSEVPVSAIYDYLDSSKPIRSGRFKHEVLKPPVAIQHEIINFKQYNGPNKPYLLYRVFNAGEAAIDIVAKSAKTSSKEVVLTTLAADQSYDFGFNATGFPNNGDANKAIWVRSTDHTKPIKGMYEYLGTDT